MGAITKTLLKQKDLPTNPTEATDFIIHVQLFCFIRHQPCHTEVNYHTISVGARQQFVCTQGVAR